MKCRFCKEPLTHVFIDLVTSPPSNSFLSKEDLDEPETYFPLRVFVCERCFLVQVDEYKKSTDIFTKDYVYLSSMSRTWLDHSQRYVEMIVSRLRLNMDSQVVEIASNDGYLLQYFAKKQVPCLGIEPASGTAAVAKKKGIPVIEEFFGSSLARQLKAKGTLADLVIGNNVLAHVPDINDFVSGLSTLLKEGGTITLEFPHLMRLVENNQFDTIYHEHFSYLSLGTVRTIFRAHGLQVYDVEELTTHGGSLRVYACHVDFSGLPLSSSVQAIEDKEHGAGMNSLEYYLDFREQALKVKIDFLKFLLEAKQKGKKVAAYGAAAKGNTLLNYCGVKNDLVDFVVDAAPSKQGRYLPGSRIPVVSEVLLKKERPDYVIVLPWNITREIVEQLGYIREWDGKFVVAVPSLSIF